MGNINKVARNTIRTLTLTSRLSDERILRLSHHAAERGDKKTKELSGNLKEKIRELIYESNGQKNISF